MEIYKISAVTGEGLEELFNHVGEIIKTLPKDVQGEPKLALDGGKNGLDFYRRIINEASEFLEPNGYLCLEIGYNQKDKVINLMEKSKKYSNIYSKKDLDNNDRIVVCQKTR